MGISAGQKLCLWMIILGALSIIIGSAAPYWLTIEPATGIVKYGMWFACVGAKSDDCGLYDWQLLSLEDFSVWFFIVHGGVGIATLLAIVLLFASLVKICGNSDSATAVGVIALICAMLGIPAASVFLVKNSEDTMLLALMGERDWAFILFFVGSCVNAFFGLVVLMLPRYENYSVNPH